MEYKDVTFREKFLVFVGENAPVEGQKTQGNVPEKLGEKKEGVKEGKKGERASLANENKENLEKASEKSEKKKILEQTALIGDSLGVGMGEKMLNKEQVFAKVGAHLNEIENQLDKDVPQGKYQYLIIQGGTNDLENKSPAEIAENLNKICAKALEKGFEKITVLTIPPHKNVNGKQLGDKALAANTAIKKSLKTEVGKVELYDINTSYLNKIGGEGNLDKYVTDKDLGVHQNKEGYKILAGLLKSEITGEQPMKAGKLHGKYLEKLSDKNSDSKKADMESLGKASVADIRYKNRLLKGPAENETDKEKITNLKEETKRRIAAYTSESSEEWYTLDYKSVGGNVHEYRIGLGDILLDPDIKEILVYKNGEVIKGTRGTTGKGRVCFLDDKGRYISTFSTGNKFKIISDDEMDTKTYVSKINDEQKSREKNQDLEKDTGEEIDVNKLLTDTQTIEEIRKMIGSKNETEKDKGKSEDEKGVMEEVKNLTGDQRAMAKLIENEFKRAGLSNNIIKAAIVNAYAESRLDPKIVAGNEKEESVGLFQLNSKGGAGANMSIKDRQDPIKNISRIIEEVYTYGGALMRADRSGEPLPILAAIFSRDIERPDNKRQRMVERAKIAQNIFPA